MIDRASRHLRLLTLLAVTALGASTMAAEKRSPTDLTLLLEDYASGRYDDAVGRAAAVDDLWGLRRQYANAALQWIAADPSHAAQRRAASAAFILELAHARLGSDWTYGAKLSEVVEWACKQLRSAGPPTRFERTWDEASVAVASRARDRKWLIGQFVTLPRRLSGVAKYDQRETGDQHLRHIRRRYPDDPSFELAEVVAWTWTWSREWEPTRNMTAPQAMAAVRHLALRPPPSLAALASLEPLTREPAVAAESFIHVGYLLASIGHNEDAQHAFDAAIPVARDDLTKYLAVFSAARTQEAVGKPQLAVSTYTQALAIIPTAESATVALSSLQFGTNDRQAAVDRVAHVFADPPTFPDPGRLVGYGSYYHWPQFRAAMRAGLSE